MEKTKYNRLININKANKIKQIKQSFNEYLQKNNVSDNDISSCNGQCLDKKSQSLLKNSIFRNYFREKKNNTNICSNYKTQKRLIPKKISFHLKTLLTKIRHLPVEEFNKTQTIKHQEELMKKNLTLKVTNYRKTIKNPLVKKFSPDEYKKKKYLYIRHKPLFRSIDAERRIKNINNDSKDLEKLMETNSFFNNYLTPKKMNKCIQNGVCVENKFLSIDQSEVPKKNLFNSLYRTQSIHAKNSITSRSNSHLIITPRLPSNNIEKKKEKAARKKNIIDIIYSNNKPLFFISTHMNIIGYQKWKDLTFYEKQKYEKFMEQILDLKKQIQENFFERFEIVKNFLIQNDIKEEKYFDKKKLTILLDYFNGNFDLNIRKNLKENIIDIIKGKIQQKQKKEG